LGQQLVETTVALKAGPEMSDRIGPYIVASLAFDVQPHRIFQSCLEITTFCAGYLPYRDQQFRGRLSRELLLRSNR